MIGNTYSFGFIGLGLIGGSIAKALKLRYPDCRITAFSRSQAPLELAVTEGIVDVIASSIDGASFGRCDYIFLCTPVDNISVYLEKLAPVIHSSCTVTDAGSVKEAVHKAAHKAGLDSSFIGGHPMSGSEKTGYANSSALILENAYYIITPTEKTGDERLEKYAGIVSAIGAVPIIMDYRKHDRCVAGISHLPHLIAGSLVNLIHDSDSEDGMMKRLAAGGFKDITRIASSSPEVWEQICMNNTEAISDMLDRYINSLIEIKSHIAGNDGSYIYSLFEKSSKYRNSIDDASHSFVPRAYLLNLDIEDREGAIARVATLLAEHSISIRNIGITHNREARQGALCMEFYDMDSKLLAADILEKNNYRIYQ